MWVRGSPKNRRGVAGGRALIWLSAWVQEIATALALHKA